ncbi:MAG: hypothetical protein H5U40_07270, partial [Polyangiaceae bacterium]|nr:hypothetical protein [Polyangiaceae bacterium]
MKRIKVLLVMMALAMPAASVSAQGDDGATTYDFDDDLVSGDLVAPNGEQLIVRRRGRRG